jgi:hypothetical protein
MRENACDQSIQLLLWVAADVHKACLYGCPKEVIIGRGSELLRRRKMGSCSFHWIGARAEGRRKAEFRLLGPASFRPSQQRLETPVHSHQQCSIGQARRVQRKARQQRPCKATAGRNLGPENSTILAIAVVEAGLARYTSRQSRSQAKRRSLHIYQRVQVHREYAGFPHGQELYRNTLSIWNFVALFFSKYTGSPRYAQPDSRRIGCVCLVGTSKLAGGHAAHLIRGIHM